MVTLDDDNELSNLLSVLNADEGEQDVLEDIQESQEDAQEDEDTQESSDTEDTLENQEDAPEDVLGDENDIPENSLGGDEEDEEELEDINTIYRSSIDEVLTNYRQDRNDMSTFLEMLNHRIESEGKPSRVYFESAANILRARAESNTTMIKLLDNLSKKSDKGSLSGLDLSELLED